ACGRRGLPDRIARRGERATGAVRSWRRHRRGVAGRALRHANRGRRAHHPAGGRAHHPALQLTVDTLSQALHERPAITRIEPSTIRSSSGPNWYHVGSESPHSSEPVKPLLSSRRKRDLTLTYPATNRE